MYDRKISPALTQYTFSSALTSQLFSLSGRPNSRERIITSLLRAVFLTCTYTWRSRRGICAEIPSIFRIIGRHVERVSFRRNRGRSDGKTRTGETDRGRKDSEGWRRERDRARGRERKKEISLETHRHRRREGRLERKKDSRELRRVGWGRGWNGRWWGREKHGAPLGPGSVVGTGCGPRGEKRRHCE